MSCVSVPVHTTVNLRLKLRSAINALVSCFTCKYTEFFTMSHLVFQNLHFLSYICDLIFTDSHPLFHLSEEIKTSKTRSSKTADRQLKIHLCYCTSCHVPSIQPWRKKAADFYQVKNLQLGSKSLISTLVLQHWIPFCFQHYHPLL